jgi:hypothetical protein
MKRPLFHERKDWWHYLDQLFECPWGESGDGITRDYTEFNSGYDTSHANVKANITVRSLSTKVIKHYTSHKPRDSNINNCG